MELQLSPYSIKLLNATNYTINSADNVDAYDLEYFGGTVNEDRHYPTSKHGIRLLENDVEIRSAIVCEMGGATGIHKDCALVTTKVLFICCGDHVYCLSIPDLELKWRKRLDPATCFGIYHFHDDLIVHGELQISRVDLNGNQKWAFGARDIFVTEDGSDAFDIKKHKIYLRDWEGHHYILDEYGNEIRQ